MTDSKHVVTRIGNNEDLPEWAQTNASAPETTPEAETVPAPSGEVDVAVEPLGAPLSPSQFSSQEAASAASERIHPETISAADVFRERGSAKDWE